MLGATNTQPILFDVKYGSKGQDGIATLTILNRGTNTEKAEVSNFEVNGIEPADKLPLIASVLPKSTKVVEIRCPGQKGIDDYHSNYTLSAKGTKVQIHNGPEPSLLFISNSKNNKITLKYDSDFSSRPLEVEITSITKHRLEIITQHIVKKIAVGTKVDLPVEISRPCKIQYKIRLLGNHNWKENSIQLDNP